MVSYYPTRIAHNIHIVGLTTGWGQEMVWTLLRQTSQANEICKYWHPTACCQRLDWCFMGEYFFDDFLLYRSTSQIQRTISSLTTESHSIPGNSIPTLPQTCMMVCCGACENLVRVIRARSSTVGKGFPTVGVDTSRGKFALNCTVNVVRSTVVAFINHRFRKL